MCRALPQIKELYAKIDELKAVISRGSGWTDEQLQTKQNFKDSIDAGNACLDAKLRENEELREELAKLQQAESEARDQLDAKHAKIDELNAQADAKRDEAARELKVKQNLELELQQLQAEMESKVQTMNEKEEQKKAEDDLLAETEQQLRDSKKEMEKYLRDYEKLYRETQTKTKELETLTAQNDQSDKDNELKKKALAEKEKQLAAMIADRVKIEKDTEALSKKIEATDKQREQWEDERDDLKQKINQITNTDLKMAWREGEALKKQLETLHRERDILTRKLGSSEKTVSVIDDLIKVNENTKKNLENEINGYKSSVKAQREQIETLVRDRERHERDASAASKKYYVAVEQLKVQETQVTEYQRKIIDSTARLKQQQNLYEAVRSERNLYSKKLVQSQEEIAEMKRRFKILNHQIDQHKEEITAKDHALVKEHFNHHNVCKERESLKNELTKVRKQIVSSEQIIANQRSEIQKLEQIIQEAGEEQQRQKKEHDAIIGERNILQAQLITRNAELSTVYEKIRVNWSELQRGETRYAEAVAEVKFLKEQIQKTTLERDKAAQELAAIKELKQTVHGLDKAILRERTKIKALEEELARPLNVHRWRMLESSDPQRFEMIKKVHRMQKQIIQKREQIQATEEKIQQQEKLYVEQKAKLARQPGPELVEQLKVYQETLKDKQAQLKTVKSELDMYKEQVAEYRQKLEDVNNETREIEEEWVRKELKKRKAERQDKGAQSDDAAAPSSPPPVVAAAASTTSASVEGRSLPTPGSG